LFSKFFLRAELFEILDLILSYEEDLPVCLPVVALEFINGFFMPKFGISFEEPVGVTLLPLSDIRLEVA